MFGNGLRRWVFWPAFGFSLFTALGLPLDVMAFDETSVRLEYQSSSGCGTSEQVIARLNALRGSSSKPETRVSASISVKHTNAAYEVSFRAQTDDTQSERHLVVADCDAVIEASALLLHLTLDPTIASADTSLPLNDEGVGDLTPTSATEVTSPAEVASADKNPKPRPNVKETPLQTQLVPLEPNADPVEAPKVYSTQIPAAQVLSNELWFGLGTSLISGVPPRWSVGAAVASGLRIGHWSLHLQGSYHPVPSVPLRDVPNGRLTSSLLHVQVAGGPVWGSRVFQAGPVLGFGLEHLNATPHGIAKPESGASTWWSAMVGANLRARLVGDLGLNLNLGVLGSVERPTFTVAGVSGTVHQPSRLGWSGSLAVVWIGGGD